MDLILYTGSQSQSILHLVRGLRWSGDKAQASRSLTFDCVTELAEMTLSIRNGDHLALLDDGSACRFWGMVVQVRQTSGSPTVSVTAYDRGIYLANNDGTYKFRQIDPSAAVQQICGDYGIPYQTLVPAGVSVTRKFSAVSLWQIITTLYTKAGEQNGKRYMARFVGQNLEVTERTVLPTNLVIRPGSNLLTSTTSRSVTALRNSVAIYDSAGNRLRVLQNEESVALYGLMQRHITQQEGEDASGEAQSILDDQGEAQTITVSALGDLSVMTGDTVVVRHEAAGLEGVFWVDGDVHQWSKGLYTMQLTLNLKNVAYTANAGSDES